MTDEIKEMSMDTEPLALPALTGRVVGMPMMGWCVRALLNARADVWPAEAVDPGLPFKWQTRRCVKWRLQRAGTNLGFTGLSRGHYSTFDPDSGHVLRGSFGNVTYYRLGDVVYIREATHQDYQGLSRFRADAALTYGDWRWKNDYLPAIFMPRDAARLWFVVAGVRAPERVGSITAADVEAEGVDGVSKRPVLLPPETDWMAVADHVARHLFSEVWDAINGKRRGCSWAGSPWVWPIMLAPLLGPPSEGDGR